MGIHIVYAGIYYYKPKLAEQLNSLILEMMEKYRMKKVMVTKINMMRNGLITNEQMKNFYRRKEDVKISVNDDLDALFKDIQLGIEPDDENWTFFLPKLSEEESELVQRKDSNFMLTFVDVNNVRKAEKTAFESYSIYVNGLGHRKTFTIKSSFKRKFPSSSSL